MGEKSLPAVMQQWWAGERNGKSSECRTRLMRIHYSGRTEGWTGADGSRMFGSGRVVPFGRSSFSKTSCLSLVGSSIRFSRCKVPNSVDFRAFNSTMSTSSLTKVGVRNTRRFSLSVCRLWNRKSQPMNGISPSKGTLFSFRVMLSRTSPPTTIVGPLSTSWI